MTENEAKEWLAEDTSPTLIHIAELKKENPMEYINQAVKVACDALEEIQAYRAIGTVEEFNRLKEKNEPKKPIVNNPKINEFYVKEAKLCPSCHSYINNCSGDYCRDCGQKIDWSE